MINSVLRRLFTRVGLGVIRYPNETLRGRMSLLKYYEIDLLFDVGANTGQYAGAMRDFGFTGRIVSFEPLRQAYDKLQAQAAKDSKWEAVHSAIGDTDGDIEINVAGNSQSSSIFAMLPTHVQSAPNSAYIGKEKVRIARIDSIINQYYRSGEKLFLKVDTQGFEKKVLEGAAQSLPNIAGIQLEMSIVALYEGESLFVEMIELLEKWGYSLCSLEPGFRDPATGKLLQVDGVFFRESTKNDKK